MMWEKGENARTGIFLFPIIFSNFPKMCFSFSNHIYYHIYLSKEFQFLSCIYFLVCKWTSLTLCLSVTPSQKANFRLFQTKKSLLVTIMKFDEKSRMFSKWVENTVGKGEIARYEPFLLFPQYFQKTCTADM